MVTLPPTPGQTVGPFFGYALPYDGDSELVPATRPDAIRLYQRIGFMRFETNVFRYVAPRSPAP